MAGVGAGVWNLTKAARIISPSKNTIDTQNAVPDLSQHRKDSKAFQKVPAPSAGEEVTPQRMSRVLVRSGCCGSPAPQPHPRILPEAHSLLSEPAAVQPR